MSKVQPESGRLLESWTIGSAHARPRRRPHHIMWIANLHLILILLAYATHFYMVLDKCTCGSRHVVRSRDAAEPFQQIICKHVNTEVQSA